MSNNDICLNCGGRRGLHRHRDQKCPRDIEASMDHCDYRETVFDPVLSKELAAPKMYDLLQEILSNEGMMPDTLGKINQLLNKIKQ